MEPCTRYQVVCVSRSEGSNEVGMTSAGETKPWITNLDGRVLGLEVILLKQVIVLPWNQFLYAEGGDDEVRAVFTTHDVVAKGCGRCGLHTVHEASSRADSL